MTEKESDIWHKGYQQGYNDATHNQLFRILKTIFNILCPRLGAGHNIANKLCRIAEKEYQKEKNNFAKLMKRVLSDYTSIKKRKTISRN